MQMSDKVHPEVRLDDRSADAETGQRAFERLQSLRKVEVHQKFNMWEAVTQGIYEKANKYTVIDKETDEVVFWVQEESAKWDRICCAPYHSFTLLFFLNDTPGAVVPPADAGARKAFMTAEREGCNCCNCTKCLCCFACSPKCQDQMNVHYGHVDYRAINPYAVPQDTIFGTVWKAKNGGGLHPELFLAEQTHPRATRMEDNEALRPQNFARINGPAIWGGCSELCCDSDYNITSADNPANAGDVARVIKLRPKTCGDICAEMCTDTDKFAMDFADSGKAMTPQRKATSLASLFLLDYMLFEFDNGMLHCDSQRGLVITCFNCWCFGCACPCQVALKGNDGG